MKRDKIKIEGHVGTWYIVQETYYNGEKVYLLEHEQYGDMAAGLIVDIKLQVIRDDVWNGFVDL